MIIKTQISEGLDNYENKQYFSDETWFERDSNSSISYSEVFIIIKIRNI